MAPRSIERIDPVLDKIREIWYRHPDMRLMQLLVNVADRKEPAPSVDEWQELSERDRYHEVQKRSMGTRSMYSMEEDELIRRLEETYG